MLLSMVGKLVAWLAPCALLFAGCSAAVEEAIGEPSVELAEVASAGCPSDALLDDEGWCVQWRSLEDVYPAGSGLGLPGTDGRRVYTVATDGRGRVVFWMSPDEGSDYVVEHVDGSWSRLPDPPADMRVSDVVILSNEGLLAVGDRVRSIPGESGLESLGPVTMRLVKDGKRWDSIPPPVPAVYSTEIVSMRGGALSLIRAKDGAYSAWRIEDGGLNWKEVRAPGQNRQLAALRNGEVLALGSDTPMRFDPRASRWRPSAILPGRPKYSVEFTFLPDGSPMVLNVPIRELQSNVFSYDVSADRWLARSPLHDLTLMANPSFAALSPTRMLVVGSGAETATYDVRANRWAESVPAPVQFEHANAYALGKNRVLATDGRLAQVYEASPPRSSHKVAWRSTENLFSVPDASRRWSGELKRRALACLAKDPVCAEPAEPFFTMSVDPAFEADSDDGPLKPARARKRGQTSAYRIQSILQAPTVAVYGSVGFKEKVTARRPDGSAVITVDVESPRGRAVSDYGEMIPLQGEAKHGTVQAAADGTITSMATDSKEGAVPKAVEDLVRNFANGARVDRRVEVGESWTRSFDFDVTPNVEDIEIDVEVKATATFTFRGWRKLSNGSRVAWIETNLIIRGQGATETGERARPLGYFGVARGVVYWDRRRDEPFQTAFEQSAALALGDRARVTRSRIVVTRQGDALSAVPSDALVTTAARLEPVPTSLEMPPREESDPNDDEDGPPPPPEPPVKDLPEPVEAKPEDRGPIVNLGFKEVRGSISRPKAPAKPKRSGRVPGGVPGGVVGGVGAPRADHKTKLPKSVLTATKFRGYLRAMSRLKPLMRPGQRLKARIRLCVDRHGKAFGVSVQKSTGDKAVDRELRKMIGGWRFTPFVDRDGRPMTPCVAVGVKVAYE